MTQKHSTIYKAHDVQVTLGCSRKKVYRIFHEKEFPGFKIHGTWYVRADEFHEWLDYKSQKKKNLTIKERR